MPHEQNDFIMEDDLSRQICTECGGDAGDTDNNGLIVHGGYGSVLYDTTQLIWLVRGDEAAKPGMLCDSCIDGFIAAGKLEAFSTSIGTLPEGAPSEVAYRELFAYGARKTYHKFWQEQGDHPYTRRPLDKKGEKSIKRLRNSLIGDDNGFTVGPPDRAQLAWRAISVGEAHALSAIALGYGEEDPGFETAAAQWTELRRSMDTEIAEISEEFSSENLLAALSDSRQNPA